MSGWDYDLMDVRDDNVWDEDTYLPYPVYLPYSRVERETEKGILLVTPLGKCWLPKNYIMLKKRYAKIPSWVNVEFMEQNKTPLASDQQEG